MPFNKNQSSEYGRVPISDDQHSLKAGLRGPALAEDFVLREKVTLFYCRK
jgi:catalase